jgi:hypothetical protein
MLTRLEAQYRSQITFTSDFHELVNGNLKPGQPLRLSYDPQRIIPAGEPYTFGDPQRPVTAHVRFGSVSQIVLVVLSSPGMVAVPDRDATGQGSMLKAHLEVPANAEMISIWFSFTLLDGTAVYDSDFGTNFNFRFPEHDLEDLDTNVVFDREKKISLFYVHVSTTAAVDRVSVRLGRAGKQAGKDELPLQELAPSSDSHRKTWAINDVIVPTGVVIAFKVFYWIRGIRFKDDNTGHYYLSPPRPPEHIPPPPLELGRAALAWK